MSRAGVFNSTTTTALASRFGEEINKYQDDGYGNWIEQREFDWSSDRRSKPMRLGTVTRRTITYY
jgi:hypothetical protein